MTSEWSDDEEEDDDDDEMAETAEDEGTFFAIFLRLKSIAAMILQVMNWLAIM